MREVPVELLEVNLDQPTSQTHIDGYRARPDDGEVPCVVATSDGRWVVLDGKHHAIAAAIEARPVPARVVEEPAGAVRPRWLAEFGPVHHTPEVRRAVAP